MSPANSGASCIASGRCRVPAGNRTVAGINPATRLFFFVFKNAPNMLRTQINKYVGRLAEPPYFIRPPGNNIKLLNLHS